MSTDAAKIFANDWYGRGDEAGDCQIFWLTLLRDVFDVDKPERLIKFNEPVDGKFIDAYIVRTKVLIEHKSFGVDLNKKYLQSDGESLTPFEQAMRYAERLPANDKPRWIVVCNFAEFHIYNMMKNLFKPELTVIKLRDLRYQFERLRFLIYPNADTTPPAEKISKDAIEIIKKIYDDFAANYRQNKVKEFADALNKICMRIVFCLYADDAQLFTGNQFFKYLQSFSDSDRNVALQKIFDTLDTPDELRGELDTALKNFPYVNGGLFAEKIPLPEYNKDVGNPIATIAVLNVRRQFSWHEIDPPVFGAMFESMFSRADKKSNRQREGGMYYTTTDNIHKVIDPLFFDDLQNEFDVAKRMRRKNRPQAMMKLQDKLASLNFLDPACGSGNFLTETYRSLRRLENEILEELRGLKVTLPANPVKVSINQFYGIEIDPFAAAVAQTALWIAENQMLQQTEAAIGKELNALPLKNYATVICDNALRRDWADVVAPDKVSYIIGNPPFVGYSMQTPEQKKDMRIVWADSPKAGKLDYVSAWYRKAAEFIRGTKIRCAFVSTNSVCQGEQCADVWQILCEQLGVHIDFAHRTFKWLSDSDNMAHVHCIVVGFSTAPGVEDKKIFTDGKPRIVDNINAYLVNGEDIFVTVRKDHIQDGVSQMIYGNKPVENGNLIIEADDLDDFIKREPAAEKFIRPFIGSEEFINGKRRYCLWLESVSLNEIKKFPLIAARVEACRKFRSLSKKAATRSSADTPHLFQEIRQPKTDYILVPRVSSESRRYVPIGFMPPNAIASDSALVIPDATLYHFGVLTSSIHMAWLRTVGGRLKSDYRYSASVVYNNFPWCSVTDWQRRMIEDTAQKILDVRKKFPTWTFAALYAEDTMPDELRLAHKSNDYAVALAYGFEKFLEDEEQIVAELMKLYRRLTSG